MPSWLLPLLQLFWNHHPFQRGKRQGKSPVDWAGVEQALSLSEVLDLLIHSQSLGQATSWLLTCAPKCNLIPTGK